MSALLAGAAEPRLVVSVTDKKKTGPVRVKPSRGTVSPSRTEPRNSMLEPERATSLTGGAKPG